MGIHCFYGELQLVGNFLGGISLGDHVQHLTFPTTELLDEGFISMTGVCHFVTQFGAQIGLILLEALDRLSQVIKLAGFEHNRLNTELLQTTAFVNICLRNHHHHFQAWLMCLGLEQKFANRWIAEAGIQNKDIRLFLLDQLQSLVIIIGLTNHLNKRLAL